MSAKRFGSATLGANTPYRLFTSEGDMDTTASFSFVNHSNSHSLVALAMSPSELSAPRNEDYIIKGASVQSGNYYEYRGLAIESDQSIWVVSNVANVTVIATGFEESKEIE